MTIDIIVIQTPFFVKMRSYRVFRVISGLLLAVAVLAGCSKTGIKPNSTTSTTKTSTGTTTATDTLPSFYSPVGVALDASGNIYVADYGNNMIRKITTGGVVSTFAGSGVEGYINATGALAVFNEPRGLTLDASGNVYVADAGNNRIRKITATGVVTTFAGSDSTGLINGAALTAAFFAPSAVALDASGNVLVADAGNGLIRMVTQAGVVSSRSGAVTGTFNNPTGVAVTTGGNIYVANFLNNTISLIDPTGAISVFAGSGQQGYLDGLGTAAAFYYPNSVALDALNNVYVSDGVNNLIRKITPAGLVSTLAGSGTAGAVDSTGIAASFNGPAGLAVDASGNVYVADSNNNLIRKITPAGKVTTIAGNGKSGAKNGKTQVHTSGPIAVQVSDKRVVN